MLASVAEQANLSLTWLETPEDTFSHDEAHMFYSAQTFIIFIRRVLISHNCSVRIAVLYHHVNNNHVRIT